VTNLHDPHLQKLQFYATAPYDCSYLPQRQARSQVATPGEWIDTHLYSQLVRAGFRRSGLFTYKPYCAECTACISIRIPVQKFKPNKSQQRAWKSHHNLHVHPCPLEFSDTHYQLYQRYQKKRHAQGGMAEDNRQQYQQFLLQSRVDSTLFEFIDDSPQPSPATSSLKMVSLVDRLDDGLSAVYAFFEPDERASYGIFNVLWLIQYASKLGLPYVYLGYWVQNSHKMNYKTRYKPFELLQNNVWVEYAHGDVI
jgi:leucyl-tRNA---protein transferase